MTRVASIPWAVCTALSLFDPAPTAADERFAGTWQARLGSGGVNTAIRVVMSADGAFNTVVASDGSAPMRISGTYHVVDGGTIRFVNKDYSPRESCVTKSDGQSTCMAVALPPEETDSYRFENGGRMLIIANPEAGIMRFEKVE